MGFGDVLYSGVASMAVATSQEINHRAGYNIASRRARVGPSLVPNHYEGRIKLRLPHGKMRAFT